MCSNIAIKVDGLSKCYHIYEKPRDRLLQMVMRGGRKYYAEFWALKNVSFEVNVGETLGIVGSNGSGKSTLLHTICGTLNPTSGSIETNGRIAALLELGAGFNPDFTGRENIYMSAALLGLSREEIDRHYNSIVEFADIGSFIEQPVRMYSSGMFVKLGFSVIAHANADILIIDEALAVGDAVFIHKCMRFLRRFKEHGTLLFVSHDMSAILSFCDKAIWLDAGGVKQIGMAKEVANSYLLFTQQKGHGSDSEILQISAPYGVCEESGIVMSKPHASDENPIDYEAKLELHNNLSSSGGWGTGDGEIISVNLENIDSERDKNSVFCGGQLVRLIIMATLKAEMKNPILGFLVRDRLGQDLFGENTLALTEVSHFPVHAGVIIEAEFDFRLPMLQNGQYSMMASLADGDLHNHIQHHWVHEALIFDVFSSRVRWGLVGLQFDKVCLRAVL